ncbi:alpha/beta hydrolase family protein [Candidatus Uabimicrobium amorphum]|uniref:Alpha/beta hydrolase n=1 Tax=Uabimicrobium amorphum TaxID=2596890 RepID=A0A5S9IT07_UABAM|nr:alpha/beta family hydrolase [Candidatus Uabimicrobium amorphum]BBM86095.1 alpha/beta hydrolase [Candidatus Uabimicrobium amorphum]
MTKAKYTEGMFLATKDKGEVSFLLCVPKDAIAMIVLGHGAGAGMRHKHMEDIAQSLESNKIATFRYQFPFMERGGGRDAQSVSLATVQAAIDKARSLQKNLPLFAGGHSFGGRMTSLYCAEKSIEDLCGLIFFSFPLHPSGKPDTKRAQHFAQIQKPMLFLSGTRDKLAQLDLLQSVCAEHAQYISLHLLDTADHSFKILKRSRKSEKNIYDEAAETAFEFIQSLC